MWHKIKSVAEKYYFLYRRTQYFRNFQIKKHFIEGVIFIRISRGEEFDVKEELSFCGADSDFIENVIMSIKTFDDEFDDLFLFDDDKKIWEKWFKLNKKRFERDYNAWIKNFQLVINPSKYPLVGRDRLT